MKKAGHFTAFLLPVLIVIGYYLGGWWNMLTIVFVFVFEPILDHFSGLDTKKHSESEVAELLNSRFFDFVLYSWVTAQIALLIWSIFIVTNGKLTYWYEWAGFTLSMSLITGGIGITVAHELGHRVGKLERVLSKTLLFTVGYMHFFIEHNKGHHKKVATAEDPATAREGENFYAFWLRSVIQGYLSAWKIEFRRLQKSGKGRFSLDNHMIWYSLAPFLGLGLIYFGFYNIYGEGANKLLWFLPVQAIGAFTLLELVNYLEHYGLVRKTKENGLPERVSSIHSWNADHRLSNFFLFQLQRHSDHHAQASKPYQILEHHEDSPQLPMGYPTLVLMALIPPLWFRFMNPRLENWRLTLSS